MLSPAPEWRLRYMDDIGAAPELKTCAAGLAALWNTDPAYVGHHLIREIHARQMARECISQTMLHEELALAGFTRPASQLLNGESAACWTPVLIETVCRFFRRYSFKDWLTRQWCAELMESCNLIFPSDAQEQTMNHHVEQAVALKHASAANPDIQLAGLADLANANPKRFGKELTTLLKIQSCSLDNLVGEFSRRNIEPRGMKTLMPWVQAQVQPNWTANHMKGILRLTEVTVDTLIRSMDQPENDQQSEGQLQELPPAGNIKTSAEVSPAVRQAFAPARLLALANQNRQAFGEMLSTMLQKRQKTKMDLHKSLAASGSVNSANQNTYNLVAGKAPWGEKKIAGVVEFFGLSEAELLESFETYLAGSTAVAATAPEPIAVQGNSAPPPAPQESPATAQAAAGPEAGCASVETAAENETEETPAGEAAAADEAADEGDPEDGAEAGLEPITHVTEEPEVRPQPETALETTASPNMVMEMTLQEEPAGLMRTYRFQPAEQGMLEMTAGRLQGMPEPERRQALTALVEGLDISDELMSRVLWQLVQAHAAGLPEGSTARLKVLHAALGKTL